MIETEHAKVFHGSNLDVLPTLADNSIDAIVTDPPYELGFMGKSWDSSGIAYSVELWSECMRVLKPGGHLLAFGGSRTWHRLAVAIEDAGFEMRDSIAWLYGSGFPKSMDVSKAIDKGTGKNKQRQLKFVEWMRSTGITAQQINKATGTQMASHYIGLSQPAIATADLFDKLRPYLPEVPEEIERLVAERTGIEWTAYKNREVIGTEIRYNEPSGIVNVGQGQRELIERKITLASTPEAQKWAGWGTALKPAFEPVVVARKPFKGTVASNVLEWGVGGLNIDGSRIGTEKISTHHAPKGTFAGGEQDRGSDTSTYQEHTGRWPANIILDPYTAELLDEQQEEVSRFFYVAKASKHDRNEGLEELPLVKAGSMAGGEDLRDNKPTNHPERQNFHPTVKPTSLMRYLIKLVTPPNGTVLDPFTGSGSTGKAAILEGFNFVGIELTEDYLPIIKGRLEHAEATRNADATEQEQEQKETLF